MSTELLTVAIPFYGERRLLEVAVGSVLRQSTGNWQLLVCDDASPEQGVAGWLSGLCDPRIQYLRNPHNLGIVGCFNKCLDEARTDLVTLLHQDDYFLPDYCEAIQSIASSYPTAAGIFCRPRIVGPTGRRLLSFPDLVKHFLTPRAKSGLLVLAGEIAVASLLKANFIYAPTMCFRQSVLRHRRFAQHWKQVLDTELHLRLLLEGETFVGIDSRHYAYRRHDAQATRQHINSLEYFVEEAQLYDLVIAHTNDLGWGLACRIAKKKHIIKLHLAYQILYDLMRLEGRKAVQKLRLLRTVYRQTIIGPISHDKDDAAPGPGPTSA